MQSITTLIMPAEATTYWTIDTVICNEFVNYPTEILKEKTYCYHVSQQCYDFRMLLINIKSPTSFANLRTIDRIIRYQMFALPTRSISERSQRTWLKTFHIVPVYSAKKKISIPFRNNIINRAMVKMEDICSNINN